MKYILDIGCTLSRHQQIGIHAVVNARGGRQDLNELTQEDIEMRRDADKIRAWLKSRICIHQLNSKHFRKQLPRLGHLLCVYSEGR